MTSPASTRLLVGFGPEVEQVGQIALELRDFGADGRDQRLVARSAAPQLATPLGDRRQAGLEILADRREQGRADPVAFAQLGRTRAPRPRAGCARAPARPGRADCRAASSWSSAHRPACRRRAQGPSRRAPPCRIAPDRTAIRSASTASTPRPAGSPDCRSPRRRRRCRSASA